MRAAYCKKTMHEEVEWSQTLAETWKKDSTICGHARSVRYVFAKEDDWTRIRQDQRKGGRATNAGMFMFIHVNVHWEATDDSSLYCT